ncbi:MAG: hypothetical protein SH859_17185 [Hyphomicrobium aestuarii]|mgnify:CR=1 FL=1|nr:hypothetical protein [Hyphomicrobium aestuarii]
MIQVITLPVAGRDLHITADLETTKRLEAVLGALYPFAGRLERAELTHQDVAQIYGVLFRGYPDPPTMAELTAHVFEQGLHAHKRLAFLLAALTLGTAARERHLQRLQANIDGTIAPSKADELRAGSVPT